MIIVVSSIGNGNGGKHYNIVVMVMMMRTASVSIWFWFGRRSASIAVIGCIVVGMKWKMLIDGRSFRPGPIAPK